MTTQIVTSVRWMSDKPYPGVKPHQAGERPLSGQPIARLHPGWFSGRLFMGSPEGEMQNMN